MYMYTRNQHTHVTSTPAAHIMYSTVMLQQLLTAACTPELVLYDSVHNTSGPELCRVVAVLREVEEDRLIALTARDEAKIVL